MRRKKIGKIYFRWQRGVTRIQMACSKSTMRRRLSISFMVFVFLFSFSPNIYADSAENSIRAANQEINGWLAKLNAIADSNKTTICFELPKISTPAFTDDSAKNSQLLIDFQKFLYGNFFTDMSEKIRNCANANDPDYFTKASIVAKDSYAVRLRERTKFTQECISYLLNLYPAPNIPIFTQSKSENEVILGKYKILIEDQIIKTSEIVKYRYEPFCMPSEKFYQALSQTLFEKYYALYKAKYPDACKEIVFPPSDPGYIFVQDAYKQGGPSAADVRVGFYERMLIAKFDDLPNEIQHRCNTTNGNIEIISIKNFSLSPSVLKAGSKFELSFDFSCQTNCFKPIVEIANEPISSDWYVSDTVVSGNVKNGKWLFVLKIPEYSTLSGKQPIRIILSDGKAKEIYQSTLDIAAKTAIRLATDLKSEFSRANDSAIDLNFTIWLELSDGKLNQEASNDLKSNTILSLSKGVLCSSNFLPDFTVQEGDRYGSVSWNVRIKLKQYVGTCSIAVFLRLPTNYTLIGSDYFKFTIKNSKPPVVLRIKCTNGTRIINVSGTKPKCPPGYSKKI